MKTHELEMDNFHSAEELVQFLRDHDLKAGDTLRVLTDEESQSIMIIGAAVIVALAIIYFFDKAKEQRISDGEEILDTLFKGKTIEEIEELVQDEYGVKIEMEYQSDSNEKGEWQLLATQQFHKTYSDFEPEYTEADIKESNPEYSIWKEK